MEKVFVEREALNKKLAENIVKYKIVNIAANVGYGKTMAVKNFLEEYYEDYIFLSSKGKSFANMLNGDTSFDYEIIAIDDVSSILDLKRQEALFEYIEQSESHFILITRAASTVWLKPFEINSQMITVGVNDLQFSSEEVQEYLRQCSNLFNDINVENLSHTVNGCPLILYFFSKQIAAGVTNNKELIEAVKTELYAYYDAVILRKWRQEIRLFMMKISVFNSFDIGLAECMLGNKAAGPVINELISMGDFISFSPQNLYKVNGMFTEYFRRKLTENISAENISKIYISAGQYYESNGKIQAAAEVYKNAADMNRLCKLLSENSKNIHESSLITDLREYYFSWNSSSEANPEITATQSLLYAYYGNISESDNCYKIIKSLAEGSSNECMPLQLYLELILPQRSPKRLIKNLKLINSVYKQSGKKSYKLAICGNMPSIVDGIIDLCIFLKYASLINKNKKSGFEKKFGFLSAGLYNTLLGEIEFELCDNTEFTNALNRVSNGFTDALANGNEQVHFSACAVISRIVLAEGNIEMAKALTKGFKLNIRLGFNNRYIISNLEALKIMLDLYSGNTSEVETWLNAESGFDELCFLDRFVFLIKVKSCIALGKYEDAVIYIQKLQFFADNFHRIYLEIKLNILNAILLFRTGKSAWEVHLNSALKKAEKYRLYRVIADEGAAALPLLINKKFLPECSKAFFEKTVSLTRKHANFYPLYLRQVPEKQKTVNISRTEKEVLNLTVNGLSNIEIAEFLNISLNTVKFHMKNIFNKLSVNNRYHAITRAKELDLI